MVSFFFYTYGQPYPTFRFHLDILLFDVPLALLLEGSMSRFCRLYHSSVGWSTYNFGSCWRLESEEIFSKSRAIPEYYPESNGLPKFYVTWQSDHKNVFAKHHESSDPNEVCTHLRKLQLRSTNQEIFAVLPFAHVGLISPPSLDLLLNLDLTTKP